MTSRLRRKSGMALLEATTALFVAAVVFSGIFQMYGHGRDALLTVQEQRIADRILLNEQAALAAMPFADLKAAADAPLSVTPPEWAYLPNAVASVTIQDVEGAGGTLKEATVSISWTALNSRVATREISTYIAARRTMP